MAMLVPYEQHALVPKAGMFTASVCRPDTHCTTCGELLSLFGHCRQHDYPPMDPKQDAITQTTIVTPSSPTRADVVADE
jgi:hypothetical protein